jgi:transcriptional repressor NrdR
MKCPYCRATATEVYNTRTTKFATQIWRRRRCTHCGHAFTTYETPDLSFLRVAPPQGKPQPYSRAHLFSSLYAAFLDIPHKPSTIDAVTDTIEAKILELSRSTITTAEIAAIILTTLKHFNDAAYLRYLATHAELASRAEFKKALRQY